MPRKVSVVLSHWSHMIEGLKDSTQQFYTSLESTVNKKQVPDIKITRINYSEGGILSAKREYFRVRRKDHIFDICGAPFGNGFFISWWLGESLGFFWRVILKIPLFGVLMFRLFKPQTYYQLDTALMFQSLIHSAVLECVDELTQANGLRALPDSERKPIMTQLFTSSNLSG